ncbi:MAG: DUF1801 domain-containing protein [Vitreoscilla sp.]|nr:DUF1801 domain-containing protein [Vitreoscilla sp.]
MKPNPVEDLLDDLRAADADRAALVDRLRKLVLGIDPKITEDVKYGGILFSAGPPFCGVFSYQNHVSLEFGRGAELPDVHQVLEGGGKLRRHIKIQQPQDLFRKNVRHYVQLGFAAAVQSVAAMKKAKRRP